MVKQTVHPWYKGVHEWMVKGTAELNNPIKYHDSSQGEVSYHPKILLLQGSKVNRILWFAYWISTNKTGGKVKWGQGPPLLEENVLLELLEKAANQGLLSKGFIKKLHNKLSFILES